MQHGDAACYKKSAGLLVNPKSTGSERCLFAHLFSLYGMCAHTRSRYGLIDDRATRPFIRKATQHMRVVSHIHPF